MDAARTMPFDLLELEALASNPDALEAWLLSNATGILEVLGIDRSQVADADDVRQMLAAEFRKVRESVETDTRLPTWADVEVAIPGRMTPEELHNVLAGGTRTRRPG